MSRTRISDNNTKARSTLALKYKRQLPQPVVAAINVPRRNIFRAKQQHTNLHSPNKKLRYVRNCDM